MLKRPASSTVDTRDPKQPRTEFKQELPYGDVRTNYWPLELSTNNKIFKYHYEFADDKIINEPSQLNKVFKIAFTSMNLPPKSRFFVWGNSLFSLVQIPQNYLKAPLAVSENGSEVTMCSVIISGPDTFNFQANVQGMQRIYRQSGEQQYEMTWRTEGAFICQIINILLKPILTKGLGLTPMGRRGFFNASAGEGNDRNVSFMPGFSPVVMLHNNRLFLHTDFQYRAIARDHSLHYVRSTDPKEMIGQSVYCEHNRRHYIVSAVRSDLTPRSTFDLKDGTKVSYAQYYEKRYGLRLRTENQPMLEVTQRRKQGVESIFLVPEFCKIAGIPKHELKNTRLPTTSTVERFHKLSKFISDFANASRGAEFSSVKLHQEFFNPEAVTLRPQSIQFNSSKPHRASQPLWDQMLRNDSGNKLLSVPSFRWEIWVIGDHLLEKDARSFYDTFIKLMRPLCSTNLEQPTWVRDSHVNIRQAVSKTKPAVVLVVLRSVDVDIYNTIKRDLLHAGVPAQVVVRDKFMKGDRPDMSKVTKAGLQLLTKAGAVPWSTAFEDNDPLLNKLSSLHTCVFGIERSIGRKTGATTKIAVTCTVDRNPLTFSEYFNYHAGETANSMPSLQSVIERGLHAFRTKNNKLPGRLLFYSSGASEGALKAVLATDVQEVTNAVKELYKGMPEPEVLYVLVCRGGTTRLFACNNGAVSNVKPGTLVEKHICDGKSEFYLVSHDAGQKSVLAPKYILAHHAPSLDDKKQVATLTIKDVQRLSYALCHLYYNWPGPISCPAPLKYADKLAKLAAAAMLPSRPDNSLATKLFYI
eukprot:TRINITY_DN1712_c0_g1_i1.p1 TRINITY_DN1712_c0_g1~~TRINITY_DN1712_c0_g1_i1.p1  ORF type:complete len:808 (-),score=167.64 TRINITY_DN1712_c0_g1_i1:34-2457(-)